MFWAYSSSTSRPTQGPGLLIRRGLLPARGAAEHSATGVCGELRVLGTSVNDVFGSPCSGRWPARRTQRATAGARMQRPRSATRIGWIEATAYGIELRPWSG